MGSGKKKRKSRREQRMAEEASMSLPAPDKSDLAWMLLKYRKALQENPGQTLSDFLMSYGVNGLMFRLWCSASHLFCAPEKYACVWHGTSLNRAIQILESGFRTPTYTSLEPEVCINYAERRSGVESDLPPRSSPAYLSNYTFRNALTYQCLTSATLFSRHFPGVIRSLFLSHLKKSHHPDYLR